MRDIITYLCIIYHRKLDDVIRSPIACAFCWNYAKYKDFNILY